MIRIILDIKNNWEKYFKIENLFVPMKDKSFHASYQEKQTTVQRERKREVFQLMTTGESSAECSTRHAETDKAIRWWLRDLTHTLTINASSLSLSSWRTILFPIKSAQYARVPRPPCVTYEPVSVTWGLGLNSRPDVGGNGFHIRKHVQCKLHLLDYMS